MTRKKSICINLTLIKKLKKKKANKNKKIIKKIMRTKMIKLYKIMISKQRNHLNKKKFKKEIKLRRRKEKIMR